MDVFTVDNNNFLISVVRPLDLTLTTFVKSLVGKDKKKVVRDQVDLLKSKSIPRELHSKKARLQS
jgi:hypothetical protein